jgi:hypothetical protein
MDAECREHFADMTPEILAAVERLEQLVPPTVFDEIVRLTTRVADHASNHMRELVEQETAQVLAHFPGVAPAWWVVYAHRRDEIPPPCSPGRPPGRCTLPPLEEPL